MSIMIISILCHRRSDPTDDHYCACTHNKKSCDRAGKISFFSGRTHQFQANFYNHCTYQRFVVVLLQSNLGGDLQSARHTAETRQRKNVLCAFSSLRSSSVLNETHSQQRSHFVCVNDCGRIRVIAAAPLVLRIFSLQFAAESSKEFSSSSVQCLYKVCDLKIQEVNMC